MNMVEVDKISIGGGSNYKDKMVKRSPSKNSNRATDYLTPDARQVFI